MEEAFVVGDMHADLQCAQAWVRRSGFVDLEASPWAWVGGESRALVFLGDYVDKGWQGRQVMEFVRNLTTMFPRNVVALLGNHDLYLLLDTLLLDGASPVMGIPVRDYAFAFTHPEEFLNWLPGNGTTQDTEVLLPALFDALDFVYSQRKEREVLLRAVSSGPGSRADLFAVAPPFKEDPDLAAAARRRLEEWQRHMYQGLVDSGLAAWMADRPLVARVGGALLMHGGLPAKVLKKLRKQAPEQELYKVLEKATTSSFRHMWEGGRLSTPAAVTGNLEGLGPRDPIHELVTYRGLHKSCDEVAEVLDMLNDTADGPELLVVGHTPGDNVRLSCDGRFAALDSSLSRYFRQHGNLYCPDRTRQEGQAAVNRGKRLKDCGMPVPDECGGQAGRVSFTEGRWRLTPVVLSEASRRQSVENSAAPKTIENPATSKTIAGCAVAALFCLRLLLPWLRAGQGREEPNAKTD